jgi:Zn-dependent M28 family amino/carboxypeptidase
MKQNFKTKVSAAALATTLMTLSGCGPDTGNQTWVHKNLAGLIEFQSGKSFSRGRNSPLQGEHFIWRGSQVGLSISSENVSVLREKLNRGNLVMVSFIPGSEIGETLKDAPSTWAYQTDDDEGHAFVFIQDMFTLNGLAALAHKDKGCGALQLLTLANMEAGASTLIPPVYSEFLTLSPVADGKDKVSAAAIEEVVKKLEAQGTRFHSTDTGLATTSVVETLFKNAAGSMPGFTTEQFSHENSSSSTATSQKSVIAAIPGKKDNDTTIIIGAHLDSINVAGATENAPGADDDASGIATLTEVIRVIAENGWTFDRRIEFHGYAAEEVGLIGSTHIAQTYREKGRKVAAMLQVDMNSWSTDPSSTTIHIVDQFTSSTLNRSLKDLLNSYLDGDFVQKTLKGGTSDHKSWYLSGYPAVFPFEDPASYNHSIHSDKDTSANANNFAMSARFSKLILTFLAHHAGLTQAGDVSSAKSQFIGNIASDLYLAIGPTSSEGFFTFAVSAPESVETIEICRSNAAGDPGCIEEKEISVRSDDLTGRRIFSVASELSVEDGSRFAVFGYDAEEKIKALRTVRLNNL